MGLLAVLIVAAAAMAFNADELSVAALRDTVTAVGPLAPVGYALVYAVATVLLFPGAPFTITAGILFGPFVGVATALAGASLGAVGAFGLGRFVGRGAVEELAGRRISGLDGFLQRRGFVAVLLLRLVPLIPFNILNLVAGVTALRLRPYTLATVVGIFPGVVVYAVLGGSIDDPTSPTFLGAVAAFVVMAVVAGLVARRLERRGDVPAT